MLFWLFYSLGSLLWIGRVNAGQSGQATYFAVGLGACGWINVPTDFIVALNHEQFDVGTGYPGPMCGRGLTIYYEGKSAHATVADRCPGCAYGDLDMSVGLFSYLEDLSVGRFTMSWSWDGESDAQSTTHTQTPSEEPSKTHSHTSSYVSSTISVSQNTTSVPSTTSLPPTPTSPVSPMATLNPSPAVLLNVNNVVLNMGNLISIAQWARDEEALGSSR